MIARTRIVVLPPPPSLKARSQTRERTPDRRVRSETPLYYEVAISSHRLNQEEFKQRRSTQRRPTRILRYSKRALATQ